MTRPPSCRLGLAIAIAYGAGCGDNTPLCGDGLIEVIGACEPEPSKVCSDGTRRENGRCVVDPASCQAGTVLIGGRCADPTRALVIDLEESVEPNGLAIAPGVEPSTAPAGTLTPKPLDQALIVHGHITPFRDADGDGQLDPDFDSYLLTVVAPTLLEITVDGVGGAKGAFYAIGDRDGAVPAYERYGVTVTGDTSSRRLFLPAAGLYRLAITDTRSVAVGRNPPPGDGSAAGGPSAEYYASLTARAVPAPSAIAVTGGTGSQAGTLATDEVKFVTAALGAGVHDLELAMPGDAAASLAVLDADRLAGYADEPPSQAPARVTGIAPGASPLIVVDAVHNEGPAPEAFTLSVTVR